MDANNVIEIINPALFNTTPDSSVLEKYESFKSCKSISNYYIIANLVHPESDLPDRSSSDVGFPSFERLLPRSFAPLPPLASCALLPHASSALSPGLDGETLATRRLVRDEFAEKSKWEQYIGSRLFFTQPRIKKIVNLVNIS